MRRRAALLLAPVAAALALVGCTADPGDSTDAETEAESESASTPTPTALVSEPIAPAEPAVLATDDPVQLAADASRSFFADAPVVVLAAPGDVLRGASVALTLGVPLLVAEAGDPGGTGADPSVTEGVAPSDAASGDPATEPPGPVGAELDRLGAETVLTVGDVTLPDGAPDVEVVEAPDGDTALAEMLDAHAGVDLELTSVAPGQEITTLASVDPEAPMLLTPEAAAPTPAPSETAGSGRGESADGGTQSATPDTATGSDRSEGAAESADATERALPLTERPDPAADGVLVLSSGDPSQVGAVANARTAGAVVQVVPSGDPRATAASVEATAAAAPEVVVGLGTVFGDAETLAWRTSTAATGAQLPGGGQLVLPGKTYVALYGNPSGPALGVLGEQDAPATIARAAAHAEPYRALTDTTVVPALEIIATVASAGAGDDGNYSAEAPVEQLRPLIDLAHEHGQYVVLDLQPGRTDFLTQAKRYEELLRLPNVGLALDPEWRLRPDQVHLRQIGQVDVAEVNQVVTWLADLTRANDLPQKVLILHQFQVRMIPGVNEVDQSRSELAVVVHVDGQGSQGAKQATWRTLHANAPNVAWWGWKNFYDEDVPMLTPEQTMQVEPRPAFVSYQ